ncbi:helix-turn-helix transcriptional regulator [Streptomyces lydicus]|nr:helix-turn-helix transcriptional regulator [Streptomyces lydicus]
MDAPAETDVAHVAAAIGDPSRARVLLALAGGGALPASALAAEAGVSNSTISGHLAKLLDARLLTVELDGRHRYYRLATTDVARALEQLALIARPLPVRSLNADTRAKALWRARLCYDHLAGRLGVAVMSALQERDILAAEQTVRSGGATGPGAGATGPGASARAPEPGAAATDVGYVLTPHGRRELTAFGVETDRLPAAGRPSATASTGPSSATTWPAHSAPRSPPGCSPWNGSATGRTAASSVSPTPGGTAWRRPSASRPTGSGEAARRGTSVTERGAPSGIP